MASRTAVTKPEPAGLPDLVATRPEDFQIDARDIQPPRLKVGSPTTGPVAEGLVPLYSLFSQKGKDDSEPAVLVEPGDTDGVVVYVLKMYKTKSANVDPNNYQIEKRRDGELRSWQFDDPSAPPFARTQYNYVCYVPASEDSDLPHNVLLGNTSTPAARLINTVIGQGMQHGKPAYTMPFALWPEKRERNDGGQTNRWAIFRARPVEAKPEDVQAAIDLLGLITTKPTNFDQDSETTANGNASAAPAI